MTVQQEISGVIASFPDRRHADYYVNELRRAGFTDNEIGVLGPHGKVEDDEEEAVAGAVTGGMVGAVAGAVATGLIPGVGPVLATGLLTGILGGATTGGVLGALVGLGIHEEKARHHEQKVLEGHTLVVVQAVGRAWEAMAILRRCEKGLGPRVTPKGMGRKGERHLGFLRHMWHDSSAAEYRTEGEAYSAQGKYAEAITDFDKAIRLDPNNATAYLDRGLAYEEEGHYQEAISDYDMAIRLDSSNAAAHLYRGDAYFALDDFHQAIHEYSEAIRLAPNFALAYHYRGLAYRETGDEVRAKADQDKATKLDPELGIK